MPMHFHWINFRATVLRTLKRSTTFSLIRWSNSVSILCPFTSLGSPHSSRCSMSHMMKLFHHLAKRPLQPSLCPLNLKVKASRTLTQRPKPNHVVISHQVLISTNTSADHDSTVLCPVRPFLERPLDSALCLRCPASICAKAFRSCHFSPSAAMHFT